MVFEFVKMNGAGNDFILLDNRRGDIRLDKAMIVRLCDRQRGVGADGLFLLEPSRDGRADCAWQFYNRDGSEAEMCGNGARCFARFARRLLGGEGRLTFQTGAGVVAAEFEDPLVLVTLTDPKDLASPQVLHVNSEPLEVHFINTGVPHAVVFVPDADRVRVTEQGAALRFHEHFAPAGANVNFVQREAEDLFRVRTYERGVEAETLACGTGVSAAALIAAVRFGLTSPIRVKVQGGDVLEVSFAREGDRFSRVGLKGPADFVFEGRIEI